MSFASPYRSGPSTPLRSPRRSTPRKSHSYDRFIPNRAAMDFDLAHHNLSQAIHQQDRVSTGDLNTTPAKEEFKEVLKETIFSSPASAANRVLRFKEPESPSPSAHPARLLSPARPWTSGPDSPEAARRKRPIRQLPDAPEKILDAPELVDDYYLNLLDWSRQNLLAIALGNSLYLWNAQNGGITRLVATRDSQDIITSVAFAADGQLLCIGTTSAQIHIWDVAQAKKTRTLTGHMSRVSSASWNPTSESLFSTGGRDSIILNHDVRASNHRVSYFEKHTQEVCGLKWSPDGSQLASGGNDNVLNVWDSTSRPTEPRFSSELHQAAVKALAWCPFQRSVLASGGGTADRCIRFWNTSSGACLNTIDTKSQVCSIQWSRHSRELVSSHGFSHNQLIVWSYPTMTKIGELTGHTSRVLHTALNPDGSMVVSAAGDETLRFWKVFEPKNEIESHIRSKNVASSFHKLQIR